MYVYIENLLWVIFLVKKFEFFKEKRNVYIIVFVFYNGEYIIFFLSFM